MNAPSITPDVSFNAEPVVRISREQMPLRWSIRRELWENRFVYVAPLAVAAVALFGSVITLLTAPMRLHKVAAADPAKFYSQLVMPFSFVPAPIMLTSFIVGMFYCLDALYGERRDRSLLFWKSLPVSDRTAVLAKALIPLAVLPFLAYTISVATQILLMTLAAPVLTSDAVTFFGMLRAIQFFELQVSMIYGLSIHALWFAPIYGWFLLVSAWAKRAPFLWALIPVFALLTLERVTFNTTYFQNMIVYRLNGAMKEGFTFQRGKQGHAERLTELELFNFLTTPGLWVGLAFAALCVVVAIRLRHTREAI